MSTPTAAALTRRSSKPLARFGDLHRLSERGAELKHHDVALAQRIDKGVMLLAGLLDPEDLVEEQILGVVRGQAAQAEVRTVDHDFAQGADFGMYARLGDGDGLVHSGLMLPFQMRVGGGQSGEDETDGDRLPRGIVKTFWPRSRRAMT